MDDNIEVFTEQVSHHPPVSASFCRGKKSRYTYWNNFASHSRFTGKSMEFTQIYRTYIEMHDHKETYEIQLPALSVHNLIIGTTYIDIGGSSTISLLENKNLKCQMRYTKRGWLSKEEFKVEGEVSKISGNKKSELLYKIHGNWNSKIYLTPYENGTLN